MHKWFRRITLLLPLLALILAGASYAQEEITDDEVNEVAKDLYCPVCESTPLDVCPTQACADWRELIRTKLSAGESRQDVLDYFARQYGDGVLANPPQRGVSLIVLWLLPVVGVLLGALLFARMLRGLRTAAPAASSAPPPPSTPAPPPPSSDPSLDAYIARVEREVNQ